MSALIIICIEDFFDNINPDEKNWNRQWRRIGIGNGGATIDKRYNWATLLLWPVKNRTAVIVAVSSNRMAFAPAMVHSNFCPINFRW